MPAVFTTYNTSQTAAFAGMPATQDTSRRMTRVAQGAIGFGVAVFTGTVERTCRTAAAGAKFLGVSIFNPALPAEQSDAYKAGDNVAIFDEGEIWVQLGADPVAANADAYVNLTTGLFTDADGADATARIGIFVTAGAASGIAMLRLDQPIPGVAP